MELETTSIEQDHCSKCDTILLENNKFCSNCGFPERGTEKEKAIFIANAVMKKNGHLDVDEKINSGKKTLLILAALCVVFGFISYGVNNDISVLVSNLILAVIYAGLAWLATTKPFAALLSALLLYIMIHILNAIVDVTTIYQGLLVKVLVITYLSKGVYSAMNQEKPDNAV